jgi:uncharacterized RDD family membrane protein YckC
MKTLHEGVQPAGLMRRLAAAVYDSLLLLALLFLATAAIAPFLPDDHVQAGALWYRGYLVLVAFIFFGWFWTHGGQTLGMRAWKLRVRKTTGGTLGWGTALLRFAAAWPAWLSVIGVVWCAVPPRKRALHDWLSGTEIVSERPPS